MSSFPKHVVRFRECTAAKRWGKWALVSLNESLLTKCFSGIDANFLNLPSEINHLLLWTAFWLACCFKNWETVVSFYLGPFFSFPQMQGCFQKLFTYNYNRVCSERTHKHKEPAGRGPPCSLILLVVQWREHPHLKGNERKDGAEKKRALLRVRPLVFLTYCLRMEWNCVIVSLLCCCAAIRATLCHVCAQVDACLEAFIQNYWLITS